MALDCLANLKYIKQKTGKKAQYFGMSQGGTTMVAALAEPDRNLAYEIGECVSTFHALAPVVLFV